MAATRPRRPARAARPAVTGRALVLGALVILLVVVLAAPLHRYLGSRGSVEQASSQLRSDEAALKALTRRQALWSDPGYIQSQARIRLQYAMPGDTVYVVVGPGEQSDGETAGPGVKVAGKSGASTWNTRLWGSVRAAGATG